MYGRVTREKKKKRYGFILGEDRKSYFAHFSNLLFRFQYKTTIKHTSKFQLFLQ